MADWDWGGAAGGAAAGASMGSIAGPWGMAIGGGLGAIGGGFGLFGGGGSKEIDPAKARWDDRDYLRQQYQLGVRLADGRVAPRTAGARLGAAAQVDQWQQAQWREQQMGQAQRLGAIASGQAQGAGELAAQRQAARQVANQQAMARMGRGSLGAAAARGAARNIADIGANAAGQSQMAALQDQQAANQMLGSVLSQGRQADLGIAAQNAQLDQQRMLQLGQMQQQAQMANLDAQLRTMGLSSQERLAYLGQLAQMNQSEMAGRLGQEQVAMSQPGLLGPMLQAGGTIGAAYAMRGGGGG